MPLLSYCNQNKIKVNHIWLEALMKPAYADRIRNLRERLNLSQESLSELTDISQNQISRYERGINNPTGDALIALAKALNTTTDYLLGLLDDSAAPYKKSDLTPKEREAIAAWRRGNKLQAMQIIMNG
jgi:transcriptional regulator with XRE-family HTH domain